MSTLSFFIGLSCGMGFTYLVAVLFAAFSRRMTQEQREASEKVERQLAEANDNRSCIAESLRAIRYNVEIIAEKKTH